MGDSSVVEFLRDLSIIVGVGMSAVLLLILTVTVVVIYKKLSRALTALQGTAQNAQEVSRAIMDKIVKPVGGNAAASYGVARIAGFLFGFIKKRRSKGDT